MQMFVKIDGVKEIQAKLAALEPKVGRRIVRTALRKAAKPILTMARALVPVDSGDLKRSIKIRNLKKRRRSYAIAVGTGPGWFQGDEYYGGIVEFGADNVAAQPFLRPAFDANSDAAQKILKTEILQQVEKAAKVKG